MTKIIDLEDMAKERGFRDSEHLLSKAAARTHHVKRAEVEGEVVARVDWGRWLADCPYCGGAELVSKKTGIFYCLSCGMARQDGRPMRAVFPDDMEEIEAELKTRGVKWQNWNMERGT
jgi:ribosomal protein L37AE/L43A